MEKRRIAHEMQRIMCDTNAKCDLCKSISNCKVLTYAYKLANADFKRCDSCNTSTSQHKQDEWKNASIELPLNDDSHESSIGVVVYVEGETKPSYRIYERATVRDKIVYRWKYPWDRISDEKITHWRYLPEKE